MAQKSKSIYGIETYTSISKVAVIGAGAAGLIVTNELIKNKFDVTVFEQSFQIGGVWQYDVSNINPMYRSLRTNLPSEIMSISYEDPFILSKSSQDIKNSCSNSKYEVDTRKSSYAEHQEVLDYLIGYASKYSLAKYIQFNSLVTKITKNPRNSKHRWSITYCCDAGNEKCGDKTNDFDAVVVCNGHFSVPFIPNIPNLAVFRGISIHSINYDSFIKANPAILTGKKILIIGSKSSGTDLTREIMQYGLAAEVHVSDRNIQSSCVLSYPEGVILDTVDEYRSSLLYYHPAIDHIDQESGAIVFTDGLQVLNIDILLWCTGYNYSFPFLQSSDQIDQIEEQLEGNKDKFSIPLEAGKRLRGLYQRLFHLQEPTLTFVGLPFSVVPFPLFYFQAMLIAAVFKGTVQLPPIEERIRLLEEEENALQYKNLFNDKYHYLGGDSQWEYCRSLVQLVLPVIDKEDNKRQKVASYIDMLQGIYNDNNKRRPTFTGGLDSYRSRRYRINWESFEWEVESD